MTSEVLYTYDSSGNLLGILYQNTTTLALIDEYRYTVDASGRVTTMVDTTPSGSTAQAYVYDDLAN